MKFDDQIGSESQICPAVQCICFSFSVQILNTLTGRDVQINKEGRNIGIMATKYCHFGGIGFDQSDSVFALVDNFLELVSVNKM